MRTPDERRRDGYHEAGHAVVAVMEGVQVSACFLDTEGGETVMQGEPGSRVAALAIAAAGVLAENGAPPSGDPVMEARFLWSEIEPYRALLNEGLSKGDIEFTLSNPHDALDVAALLHEVSDDEAKADLEAAISRIQEVLVAEWQWVELVAVAIRGAEA